MSYCINDIQEWQFKLALFHVCDYSYYANVHGVTIEDNRSYLKNNRYTGENNRGNF